MSLFKSKSNNTSTKTNDYKGTHPVLKTHKGNRYDHLKNQVEIFENSEGKAMDYLKKKKSDLGNYVATNKEKRHDRHAKKRSGKAARTIVAAIVKANTIIDSEIQHAWKVEKKQRRTENAHESGDENARKELEKSIRTEVWSELEINHRKNRKTEAFDNEILGAFDILSAKN